MTATEAVVEAFVAELRADAVAGAVLWLSHAGAASVTARRDVAARIMRASVYEQAGVLGLVRCTRCGDQGCGHCQLRRCQL